VPARATIAEPIQLLFLSTGGSCGDPSSQSRRLEREARASIVETYASLDPDVYWTNLSPKIVVGDSAR